MMPHRLYVPFAGLVQGWEGKLLASAVGALALEAAAYVGGLYGRMLEADPLLVFLVANFLVVDAVTGVAAARRRAETVSSRAMRRTGWKALEYAAVAFVGISIANGFAAGPLHVLTDGFDDAALIYVAITEAFSIAENVTGSREGARRLIRRIRDLATGRTEMVEEVVREVRLDAAEAPADPREVDPREAARPAAAPPSPPRP